MCLFGIEPELAEGDGGIRYVTSPSDAGVNELFNQATVFAQTSSHEGFCLPVLEAMATGAAVVCTDAHGNRDFCDDGRNCLMPEPDRGSVAQSMARLMRDPALRERLGRAGIQTAAEYAWAKRIDALEQFLHRIATPRTISPSTDTVPQLRRAPAK
jgi:glycosyltransferase involved in cell wall biosynthesis